MTDRASGQRLALLIPGGVSAEVRLVKVSRKPQDAKHEVRRFIDAEASAAAGGGSVNPAAEHEVVRDPATGTARVLHRSDPFGDDGHDAVELADRVAEDVYRSAQQVDEWPGEQYDGSSVQAAAAALRGAGGVPEGEARRGVTLEDGTFVDLTDELAAIDERTRIDGLEVLFTVDGRSVPRFRVRDAHYVEPAGVGSGAVLAHVAVGLREHDLAAVVRWTKRTHQALGVVTPLGRGAQVALALLEVEFSENLRPASPAAVLPIADVSPEGAARAGELMDALRRPASALGLVADERIAQRRMLLAAARAGAPLPGAPPVREVPVEQAERFADAVEAVT